jgi:hypothetical protein
MLQDQWKLWVKVSSQNEFSHDNIDMNAKMINPNTNQNQRLVQKTQIYHNQRVQMVVILP